MVKTEIYRIDHRDLSLKVQNVEIEIDVSFSTLMYPRSTIHRKLRLNTHSHAIIRPHLKFDIKFSMYCRPREH